MKKSKAFFWFALSALFNTLTAVMALVIFAAWMQP